MIATATALSFLKSNKTVIIYALIGLAALSMFGTIKYLNMRLDTEKAGRELAEYNVATLEAKEKALQEEMRASAIRSEKLNKEITIAREERNEKTEVYAKHDLEKIATKKTTLITRKMRRATTGVWMSFEQASGDDRGSTNMSEPASSGNFENAAYPSNSGNDGGEAGCIFFLQRIREHGEEPTGYPVLG